MIEAQDIRYSYPNKVEALKGVSLTIQEGEFVAIMGQNGAGKSTLVKHFNGLLKPSQGKVRVDEVGDNLEAAVLAAFVVAQVDDERCRAA